MTEQEIKKIRKTLKKQRKKGYKILAELNEASPSYGIDCAKRHLNRYIEWVQDELMDIEKNMAKN